MNGKHIGLCALVVSVLGACAVRAEDPPRGPGISMVQPVQYGGERMAPPTPYGGESMARPISYGGEPLSPPAADAGPHPVPQLSRWITGPGCDCCGPLGGRALGYEIYLRNGISLPFGSGPLAKDLDPGWVIEGGARVLFFEPNKLAAWTVDLGIVNINNHASGDHPVTLNNISVPNPIAIPGQTLPPIIAPEAIISFDHYNRTFVSATFGREWYLWDPANTCDGLIWRAGIDAGFRYGTSKLDLQNRFPFAPHRTKVIGAPVVSVHSDVEWPCGACIYQIGFRAEYSFTFSEILQDQNDADVHDFMLMLNLGVRF
jgi:hypothetical protein